MFSSRDFPAVIALRLAAGIKLGNKPTFRERIIMSKTQVRRKKGGYNQGFLYRKGRGWYVTKGSQLTAPCHEYGQHGVAQKIMSSRNVEMPIDVAIATDSVPLIFCAKRPRTPLFAGIDGGNLESRSTQLLCRRRRSRDAGVR
jgi:hypothetical protein